MKTLVAFIALTFYSFNAFSANTGTTMAFQAGEYDCIQGNNDSICPQKILQKIEHGQYMLKVVYSGYCNDQGPYTYGCEDENHCGDGMQTFEKMSADSYIWKNVSYSYKCLFQLKRK